MSKDKLTDYDATASNNTDIGGISIAEGMLPSAVNNAIREQMSHQKEAFGAGTPLYVDQTNNRVGIGTASPARQITVENTIANAGGEVGILSSDSSTSGTFGTVHFGNNTDTSLASIRAKADGSTTAGKLEFSTEADGGSIETRMTIDSSGNVGIGTNSPTATFRTSIKGDYSSIIGGIEFDSGGGDKFTIGHASATSPSGTINVVGAGNLIMNTDNTERMRIAHTTGHVGINNTAPSFPLVVSGKAANHCSAFVTATNGYAAALFYNASAAVVGQIQINASSTAYITSSDYRLKTAVTYDWDATTRLKQLKPARFKWIVDGDDAVSVDGFLAHEVQSIVPESISGNGKDAMMDEEYEVSAAEVDADGNVTKEAVMGTRSVPDYQGIDQSKLVPLLTKSLIEAVAKIEALESRITALEAG